MGSSRGILAAHQPLVVPMLLRLSQFRLNAYVVLVVSKQKGITLVFKTDPLQNVDVNSTFDSIAVIQKFIQKEIEGQLREMFREDLPAIIHRLSQRWTAGKAKVEAPYLHKNPTTLPRETVYTPSVVQPPKAESLPGNAGYGFPSVGLRPAFVPRSLSVQLPRPRTSAANSTRSRSSLRPSKPPSPAIESTSSFPDLENYDPTYGLRPEGLPTKSGYSGFGRLFASKGFADLDDVTEERDRDADFETVDWEDALPDYTSQSPSVAEESEIEYETLPAIGGGTITRPRVYHSQSVVGLPTATPTRPPSIAHSLFNPSAHRPQPRSTVSNPSNLRHRTLQHLEHEMSPSDPVSAWRERQLLEAQNPYFPEMGVAGPSRLGGLHPDTASRPRQPGHEYRSTVSDIGPYQDTRRFSGSSDPKLSASSSYTRLSHSSGPQATVSTPPSSDVLGPEEGSNSPILSGKNRRRRRSLSPSMMSPFDSLHIGSPATSEIELDPQIVLRPNLNNTISHLSTLSQSNHTLSPFTQSLEHFTVRSFPPRPPRTPDRTPSSAADKPKPTRAKRKRTIHLGKKAKADDTPQPVSSPGAPSEFSEDDVDHYFKADDAAFAGHRSLYGILS